MALRYFVQPFTLRNDPWRLEIHDADFVGTATEISGSGEGFSLEYEGDPDDPFAPIMGSRCRFNFLVQNSGHASFIASLTGAREERFSLILKRGDGFPVEWLGWMLVDEVQEADEYYPYFVGLVAVDGIVRMKEKDYADYSTGEPYEGRVTMLAHLLNCFEHIGLLALLGYGDTDVAFRSNCAYFSEDMSTDFSPFAQAEVDHDRWKQKDSQGRQKFWTVFEVMEALCIALGVRVLFTRGAYTFLQVGEMENTTQQFWEYDNTGGFITVTSGVDIDIEIDYTDDDGAKKLNGGIQTYLRPIHRVIHDYHHLTNSNRAYGFNFNYLNGPVVQQTLPGAIVVDANNETQLSIVVNFSVKTLGLSPANVGYTTYPPHRYKMRVTVRLGTFYLKRDVTVNNIYDIQPEEALWTTETSAIPIFSPIIHEADEGIERAFQLQITTPYITTDFNDYPISILVTLEKVEGPVFDTLVETVTSFPAIWQWKTTDIIIAVIDEGFGSNPALDIQRTEAYDDTPGNIGIYELKTAIGDGPRPYSWSRLTVGGTATALWKLNGLGTAYPLAELLARDIIGIRQKPLPVYQGSILDGGFWPYYRMVNASNAYWPLRVVYTNFTDQWTGDFVKIGRVFTPVVDDPYDPGVPGPGGSGGPVVANSGGPVLGGIGTPIKTPFGGSPSSEYLHVLNPHIVAGSVAGATLSGEAMVSSVNTPTPNELPINAVAFAFAKKGDSWKLVNPGTGKAQVFTVAADYVPGAAVLKVTENLAADYPPNSFLFLQNPLSYRGFGYYERGVSGEFWEIPTTAGTLPSPAVLTEEEMRRRVSVVKSGLTLIYDANPSDECFGVKPSTNEIELYLPARDEVLYLRVI